MGYDGWIEFGGVELVNLSRTAQLAEVMGIDAAWTDPASVAWIESALGGADYDDVNTAPWHDPNFSVSDEFAGVISLGVTGLDDSTLSGATTEFTDDGGYTGKARNGTAALVASAVIVASTDRGAEYGKRWLAKALRGSSDNTFCAGDEMRYFRYEGSDSDIPPIVHRRDVRTTRSVSITKKRVSDCSALWLLTFTWTANDPYEYGEDVELLSGLGTPQVESPDHPLVTNYALWPGATNLNAANAYWPGGAGTVTVVSAGWSVSESAIRATCTTTATGACDFGPRIARLSLTPGEMYTIEWDIVTSKATTLNVPTLGGSSKTGFASVATSGATATTANTPVHRWTTFIAGSGTDTRVGNQVSAPTVGDWQEISNIIIYDGERDPEIGYFDGDTPASPGHLYAWTGDENASASTLSTMEAGTLDLTQIDCPVYDYTPLYDPLYPALVPAPTVPNFYPTGWSISEGVAFQRYWAEVEPTEPSELNYVPVITLTSDVDARSIRVSIFDADLPEDDQCSPLFSAIITYLPANSTFVIDGEQKASYLSDGILRRTDSLVYGPNATPVQWPSFSDPTGLRVALDVFSDGEGGYAGGGTVRASVALVPKSD